MFNQQLKFYQRWQLKWALTFKERQELYFRAKTFKHTLKVSGPRFPMHGLCKNLHTAQSTIDTFKCMLPIIEMWEYLNRTEDNILPIQRIDALNDWRMWSGPSRVAREDLLEFTINALRSTL